MQSQTGLAANIPTQNTQTVERVEHSDSRMVCWTLDSVRICRRFDLQRNERVDARCHERSLRTTEAGTARWERCCSPPSMVRVEVEVVMRARVWTSRGMIQPCFGRGLSDRERVFDVLTNEAIQQSYVKDLLIWKTNGQRLMKRCSSQGIGEGRLNNLETMPA